MRTSFSPTAAAARMFAGRPAERGPAAMPAAEARWCEWPPRRASQPPFPGIRRALLAIQARHA
jgi:hypothetical protein